jgi:hypothetical protein
MQNTAATNKHTWKEYLRFIFDHCLFCSHLKCADISLSARYFALYLSSWFICLNVASSCQLISYLLISYLSVSPGGLNDILNCAVNEFCERKHPYHPSCIHMQFGHADVQTMFYNCSLPKFARPNSIFSIFLLTPFLPLLLLHHLFMTEQDRSRTKKCSQKYKPRQPYTLDQQQHARSMRQIWQSFTKKANKFGSEGNLRRCCSRKKMPKAINSSSSTSSSSTIRTSSL